MEHVENCVPHVLPRTGFINTLLKDSQVKQPIMSKFSLKSSFLWLKGPFTLCDLGLTDIKVDSCGSNVVKSLAVNLKSGAPTSCLDLELWQPMSACCWVVTVSRKKKISQCDWCYQPTNQNTWHELTRNTLDGFDAFSKHETVADGWHKLCSLIVRATIHLTYITQSDMLLTYSPSFKSTTVFLTVSVT